jgi:hypothetical protein
MSNQIAVSADHLEIIHEQVVLLGVDASHLAMALQAVTTDCTVSGGVINAVIMALSGNVATSDDISDQLDGILSAPQVEVTDHE